jgi:DNA-binding transcriptional ArsR family regulator
MSSKHQIHADRLKALGHPLRLAILRKVVQGPKDGTAAGVIQAHVKIPASTLSHHLATLAEAGFLEAVREGTFIRYSPCLDTLQELTDYLWEDCCKSKKTHR